MPIVKATDTNKEEVLILFPRENAAAPGGWQWDEVEVIQSAIEGFGLCVKQTETLDWTDLKYPVHIPLLGKETELGTEQDAQLFARVLQGAFVDFPFADLISPGPRHTWVTDEDELYVEPIPTAELNRSPNKYRTLHADEIILQVANSSAGKDVVYLLMSGACKLLHIPQHVFAVLRAHQQHHHVDRHFATHVASFRRRYGEHFLINAHPIFANGAYAAGCINEPNEGNSASMEMQSAKLTVKQRDQDDPFAYKAWRKFAEEFEEVLESVIYFVTTNESYEDREVS